jgi:hypothetical protein
MSLGNMTNTLIETGSRHMQQCRTNYDVLLAMAGDESELINNEHKWCMQKDELVVSCGKHLVGNAPITGTKYAYPSVVTTLGTLAEKDLQFLRCHWHLMGNTTSKDIKEKVFAASGTKGPVDESKTNQLRHFLPVGYSVGKASAHGYQGDTVASVQIGGLRTVINGGFEVQTGDLIQMYMPQAEEFSFLSNGGRKDRDINGCISDPKGTDFANPSQKDISRRDFYNRGNGVKVQKTGAGPTHTKTGMFSIKPYVESLNEKNKQYYGDKIRVFAKALSCARPFEPVDIMVARQSL